MASIRKRSGRWQVQIRCNGHRPVSKSFSNKADASAWARKIEAKLDRGDLPIDRRSLATTTLGNLLKLYLQHETPEKRGERQKRYRINQIVRHRVSKEPLNYLSAISIAGYRDERLEVVSAHSARNQARQE